MAICNGRRHQDSSRGALIDSHHSCAPSIWGVDNKLINERVASVAARHRLSPVINPSVPLKRSTGHQSCVKSPLLPFLFPAAPKQEHAATRPTCQPPLSCCISVCTVIDGDRNGRVSVCERFPGARCCHFHLPVTH